MGRYAEDTSVPANQSRAEIEKVLTKYGADTFGYGWGKNRVYITFQLRDKYQVVPRCYRIELPLPEKPGTEDKWKTGARGQMLRITVKQQTDQHEQEVRALWRALAIVIKAKLVAVEAGISTIEKEFLADLLLPNEQRLGAWLETQIQEVYTHGTMPPLLPGAAEAGTE